MKQLLVFHLEGLNFGIDLTDVERVIRAIEIHPYPKSVPFLLGLLYLYEEWIPVVNLRALLGLKEREIDLKDQLIICHQAAQKLALWVDQVEFLVSLDPQEISQNPLSTHPLTQTVAYYEEKPIFLLPLDLLLSLSNLPPTATLKVEEAK